MIRMTAEIELLKGSGEINTQSISISPAGNNISADITEVVSVRKSGSNPFLFGISKLGAGATFSGGEGYFVGSEPADKDGNFATPYTLSFSIDSLDITNINFSILFDTYNNAYPKTISGALEVSGFSYPLTVNQVGTLCVFTFNGSFSGSNIVFKIRIPDWSMPNYPLRIQGIYTGLYIYGNRQNMLSLSAPIKDRSVNEQPSYGIISNAGSLSIVDGTGEIKEYARMGLLTTDLDVSLTLEDTITKKHQSIGKFKTNKWSYNNMNYEVSIELKDDLEYWQNIKIKSQELIRNQNALKLYNDLLSFIPSKYEVQGLTQKQLNYIEKIEMPCYYWDSKSLWELWNDFCVLTLSKMYENEEGTVIIYSDING